MKKILLLGISVFGMADLASAWVRKTPQDWNSNGVVRCYNTSVSDCMGGPGKIPQIGQMVVIYDSNGGGRFATVVNVMSDPHSDDNGEPLSPAPTILEVSLRELGE